MPNDLKHLCRETGLKLKGDLVEIRVNGRRSQKVEVNDDGDGYRAASVVAWPSRLRVLPDPEGFLWSKNRVTPLVTFRIDRRGRAIGEVLIPKAGLDAEEFIFIMNTLAMECDRLEYMITGNDIH